MKYLLGIDFGGSASKVTLMDETGKVCAENASEYPTYYPKNGYAEQAPCDWERATKENIAAILKKANIGASDIDTIALDAATHSAVLTDENFNVLSNTIYWTDSRSYEEVGFLKENYGKLISDTVFHTPDTIWTLPQLLWVKKNKPEVWKKTKRIMFLKDYVRHLLTGDYVTDYIEAEGSMMFDYNTLSWSEELCAIIGFDINDLPKIVSPSDICGNVTKSAAEKFGLSEKSKVICGTTDTAMEIFAAGAVGKGDMTVKLATAGRICVITDKAYPDKNLINYSYIKKGLWYPGTATKSCAASLRWYRDTFGGDYALLDEEAEKIPIGSDGLMFHPYLTGELTPYGDSSLTASFTGMRSSHTKAHFTRALLEGVALSMLDCKIAFEKTGVAMGKSAVAIGQGNKSVLWRQILSDVLGIKLVRRKHNDSSFGSCMLAAVSAGFFKSFEEAVDKCNEVISVTEPNMENHAQYEKIYRRYKKTAEVLMPIYHGEF